MCIRLQASENPDRDKCEPDVDPAFKRYKANDRGVRALIDSLDFKPDSTRCHHEMLASYFTALYRGPLICQMEGTIVFTS